MDMETNGTTTEAVNDTATNENGANQNVTYTTNYTVKPPSQTGLATASMILGIISLVTFLVAAYSPIHIIGLILGIVHAVKNKADAALKRKAIPGIIMNSIALAIAVVTWVIIIIGIAAASASYADYY